MKSTVLSPYNHFDWMEKSRGRFQPHWNMWQRALSACVRLASISLAAAYTCRSFVTTKLRHQMEADIFLLQKSVQMLRPMVQYFQSRWYKNASRSTSQRLFCGMELLSQPAAGFKWNILFWTAVATVSYFWGLLHSILVIYQYGLYHFRRWWVWKKEIKFFKQS